MKRYSKRFLAFLLAITLIFSVIPSIAAVKAEPNSSDSGAYYLFGYINGADYGCESDWQNLGEYGFTNGKLTATFTEDSYIGVKSGDNAHWYMTDGWLGTDVSTATLYNSDTYSFTKEKNKLYVPGGVELTFTLDVDPATDSMVLSYTTGGQTPDPDPDPEPTLSDYYLTGGMNGWNTKDSAYRLSTGTNSGEYVLKNIALEEGTEVKVVNPTTNSWYPGGDNYAVPENGIFDLSFYPAGGKTGYYEGYFKLTKVGEYTPEPTEVSYYLTGTFADWGMSDAYKLSPGENEGEYVLTDVILPAGAGVKVMSSKDGWFPSGVGNEYTVASKGTYDVSFYPAGGVDGYYKGFFLLTKTGNGEIPVDHTGADDKVILHCWNWKYTEIINYLPQIKAAGYTAVQTSPAQPVKGYGPGVTGVGDWWMIYQPLGFQISPADQTWMGSKEELAALCDAAHSIGMEVIVDVVSNHVGNGWNTLYAWAISQGMSEAEAKAYTEQALPGGGKLFEITPPAELGIYNPELYPEDDPMRYFRDYVNCTDNTTEGTVHGNIGMPDLKTEEPVVQQAVLNYLKELIDVGVDGFRFDAAKHIETPSDGEYASDFWPTVVGGAQAYAQSKGTDLWTYGEILYQAAYTRKMSFYTPYIDVTDINYAGGLLYGFGEGRGAAAISSLEIRDWNGPDKEPIASKDAVVFAETHDMFADSTYSTCVFDTQTVNKAWAVAAARADVSALYFARPMGAEHNNPSDPSGWYPVGTIGLCESFDWRSPEVAAVNQFHTAFVGGDELVSDEGNFVVVERWMDAQYGAVLVNALGSAASVDISVSHLADGTYYDQITGNAFTVTAGALTGEMGATGIAVLMSSEPVICDHPEDQLFKTLEEPTCTTAGYVTTYCGVCGLLLSKEMISEPLGHLDGDGDKYCDRCGEFLGLITVYFVDTNDWIPENDYFNSIRCYAWKDTSNNGWPGTEMEIVGRTKDNHGIWKIELNPEKYSMIIFNAGEGGANQTADLSYVEDAAGKDYVIYTANYFPDGRSFDGTESLYVNTASETWWTDAGAVLHMVMIKADNTETDLTLSQVDGSVWGAVVPAGSYVSLVLTRQDPADASTIWNSTGNISIPVQGNYIEKFTDGSASASWSFWPEGSAEKVGASAGGTLEDICGHSGFEYKRYYCYEAQVCDLCGKVLDVTEVAPDPSTAKFVDVPLDKWYAKNVYWALAWGITGGTDATHFAPTKDCTREQVVTFLWAAAGRPEPETTQNPFTDVKAGKYYEKAVLWAVENNITSGMNDTTFGVGKTCTRAQVVTFLWAAAGKPQPMTADNSFTDVKDNAWYTDAVHWAVENGITSGTGNGLFSPNKTCSRAQIVTFLHAYMDLPKD